MANNVIQFTIKGVNLAGPAFRSFSQTATTAAKKVGAAFRGLQAQAMSLGGALAAMGIGLIGKSFIDAAAKTEKLQIRLQVLLGSVSEGARLFEEMSEFASRVPFEFEEIMESATTLAGVVKKGVNEVTNLMPIISDLAATSGLTIKETTDQVVRMYSAGAGAADLFRERGITAMLGFEAGVSVSAEQTMRRLIEAWEEPGSKFRGATELLATSWEGLLSMMGDKWFQFRNIVMDAGLFNYLKALAFQINESMGRGLENSKAAAEGWANTVIGAINFVMRGVGVFADAWRAMEVVWLGLQVVWAAFANGIVVRIDHMKRFWHDWTQSMGRDWTLTTAALEIAWEVFKLGFVTAVNAIVVAWETTINSILQGYNYLVDASPWQYSTRSGCRGHSFAV